jgi:hypothetical protein
MGSAAFRFHTRSPVISVSPGVVIRIGRRFDANLFQFGMMARDWCSAPATLDLNLASLARHA